MKKITLLLVLLSTITALAQGGPDLRKRGWMVINRVQDVEKASDTINDLNLAYAVYKFKALEPTKLVFTAAEKEKLTELFKSQYEPFKLSYEKYEASKTANAKVQLLKVLAKNEEDFRDLLTREQLSVYIAFASDHGMGEGLHFDSVFLPNDRLEKYKKEIL